MCPCNNNTLRAQKVGPDPNFRKIGWKIASPSQCKIPEITRGNLRPLVVASCTTTSWEIPKLRASQPTDVCPIIFLTIAEVLCHAARGRSSLTHARMSDMLGARCG